MNVGLATTVKYHKYQFNWGSPNEGKTVASERSELQTSQKAAN
jgi:hypothetical protein